MRAGSIPWATGIASIRAARRLSMPRDEVAERLAVKARELVQLNRVDAAFTEFALADERLRFPQRGCNLYLRESRPKARSSKSSEHLAIVRAVDRSRAAALGAGHVPRVQPIPEYPSLDYCGARGTLTKYSASS